jgi:hypothetical protein
MLAFLRPRCDVGELVSGLPDEAVEAMCECNRQLGHESWCPLYEMRAWIPLAVAERLVAAGTATIDTNSGTVYVQPSAAALPAGVYVSSGKGDFTPIPNYTSPHDLARQVLAALSATATDA